MSPRQVRKWAPLLGVCWSAWRASLLMESPAQVPVMQMCMMHLFVLEMQYLGNQTLHVVSFKINHLIFTLRA